MSWPAAVLFDLDGTLTDQRRGTRFSRAWSCFVSWAYYSKVRMPTILLELFETVFLHFRPNFVDGTLQLIKSLKTNGVRIGIITDRTALQVAHFFRSNNEINLAYFDFIHTRRGWLDFLIKFPIPHFTHAAMKNGGTLRPILEFLKDKHQVSRERVFFLGDNLVDLQAAREAGLQEQFFASTWGRLKPEEFRRQGVPDRQILRSLDDLKQLFLED
ncbi:MAG: HAD family hydrolase [Candidatus Paceibacteria bacterium]